MTVSYSPAKIGALRHDDPAQLQPDGSEATPRAATGSAPDTGAGPGMARKSRPLRKYRIMALRDDGSIQDSEAIGPASLLFETAFSAFARGTLIRTRHGPAAVEDLVPGCDIWTGEHGLQQLLWIGSMTLVPKISHRAARDCRVTRIMPDAFGMERPMTNLMAGPGARLLSRPAALGYGYGGEQVLCPVRDLADGVNVVEITPPSPITVYHLCLRQHATITAGGLAFETFHPGIGFERQMGPRMLELYLSLFPHVRAPEEFGALAHDRLPLMPGGRIDAA